MTPRRIAMVWVALQVVFFAGWALSEESRLEQGTSILVRTVPVDPRDLLSGQYIRLGYEFSRPDDVFAPDLKDGSEVWAVLRLVGDVHEPVAFHEERPARLGPDEVALLGRYEGWRILYGIERYFVPEGTPTPDASELTVRLSVGEDGRARIHSVYRRGASWP